MPPLLGTLLNAATGRLPYVRNQRIPVWMVLRNCPAKIGVAYSGENRRRLTEWAQRLLFGHFFRPAAWSLATPAGLEPATYPLGGDRSIQIELRGLSPCLAAAAVAHYADSSPSARPPGFSLAAREENLGDSGRGAAQCRLRSWEVKKACRRQSGRFRRSNRWNAGRSGRAISVESHAENPGSAVPQRLRIFKLGVSENSTAPSLASCPYLKYVGIGRISDENLLDFPDSRRAEVSRLSQWSSG